MSHLFAPLQMRSLTLRNRIFVRFPPVTMVKEVDAVQV